MHAGFKKIQRPFELFEECGIDNYKIELIEAAPCGSKNESTKLEGRHIRELYYVN